jgi:hypothetical protein
MDALCSLPKALIELATGLLKLKKDDHTRQRLADLLGSAADCVSAIGDSIEKGVHATERCAELDTYIAHLHKLVTKETNEETARRLTFWLKHVEAVPGVAAVDIGQRIASDVKPGWGRPDASNKPKRFARLRASF